MIRHNGPISGVAASESYIATAGYDNQVILWNRDGKIAVSRGLHDHLANRCEISSDEKYLVSASSDYTARLWQLPEMKLMTVFSDHEDDVEMVRISPCSSKVATCSQDGQVRIFSLDGRLLLSLRGHDGVVSACAWSQDGKTLVSCGDDGTVRTWDAIHGRQLEVIQPENVQTDAIAIARDGTVYAGNDAGELIRIRGARLTRLPIHRAGVKNLAVSADGKHLVTMSYDRDLAVLQSGEELRVERRIAIPSLVWARACVFQDDDHLVFGTFGSSYATLNLKTDTWDFQQVDGTDCLNAVTVHDDAVYAVGDSGRVFEMAEKESSFRPERTIAETGSLCNFIRTYNGRLVCGGHMGQVFDANTGRTLLELKSPINKAAQVGRYLVLATYVGELAVVEEVADGKYDLVGEYKILANAIKDLCGDGDKVFCCGAARDIGVFDLVTKQVIAKKENAHSNIVNSCAKVGAGRFATVSRDRRLNIWNGCDLELSLPTPHDHSIKCVAASETGRYLACASYDGKLAVYDTDQKKWSAFVKMSATGISSLYYHQQSFFASSYDGRVYRWRIS